MSSVSYCSDKGMVRNNNQDKYYISKDQNFFIVADGMGGHNGGECASAMATEIISTCIESSELRDGKIEEILGLAIARANKLIYSAACKNEDLKEMGTTALVCCIFKNKGFFANVGDSRAYLISSGKIQQITIDHSVVGELLLSGSISSEEASVHPQKNMITRAVGTESSVIVDIFTVEISKGDIILLCTDGITNMVSENEIFSAVSNGADARLLVGIANKNGGRDNSTAIIIKDIFEESNSLIGEGD